MDLEEIDINAGNWVDSVQDRDYWRALVNAALNLRFLNTLSMSIFPTEKERTVLSKYYYIYVNKIVSGLLTPTLTNH